VFDRSQKFLDCKRGMTEAQPSHTGSAASPSKAKPNNVTGIHSNSMISQYHKHSTSITSMAGVKCIKVQNSRVRTSCPSCHQHCDNAEQALTLMKSLSRVKPQSSSPDSTISQHSPNLKRLSQCESFEKVARLLHAYLSNMCLSRVLEEPTLCCPASYRPSLTWGVCLRIFFNTSPEPPSAT